MVAGNDTVQKPTPGERAHGSRTGAVLVLAAAGAALAATLLRPPWHDELFTLRLARLDVPGILDALRTDSGPPLHYFVVRFLFLAIRWTEGSAAGTLACRLPSVVALALLVGLLVQLRGERRSPAGAWLLVAWLPMLFFASEARAYAPLAACLAVAWLLGPRWIASGRRGTVAFGLVAAAVPLLHNTGLAYFAALVVGFPLFLPAEDRRRALLALASAAVPAVLWLPTLVGQPGASVAWMTAGGGAGRGGLATLGVLSPSGPFPALFESNRPIAPAWLSMGLTLLLLAGVAVGARRLATGREPGDSDDRRRAASLLVGASPALLFAVASRFGAPVYFAGRTESVAFPLLAAASALAISRLDSRSKLLFVVPWVATGILNSALWLADLRLLPPPPGVQIARRIAPLVGSADRVVGSGLWELELRHGFAHVGWKPKSDEDWFLAFPAAQLRHPGWLDPADYSPDALAEARQLRSERERGRNRLWIVWTPRLPLEGNFFPAFEGWSRQVIHRGEHIAVDLLVPPGG